MAKYFDSGYSFKMRRVTRGEDMSEALGDEYDIEEKFYGLVYKSFDGLDSFGDPRPYAETFAESDVADVWVDEGDARGQTDLTLTLCFFAVSGDDDAARIASVEDVYRSFMEFVSGCVIEYRDTGRKRKLRMYLSDGNEVKTDSLYGEVYKQVELKFKNVYGRTFAYDAELPSE